MYMFIPYDVSKELTFDNDYYPVQDKANCFKLNEIPDIIHNLFDAMDNAFSYHAERLENALFSDICYLKKWYIVRIISCCSSGTITSYIGKTQYKFIDKAVNNTIYYIFEIAKNEEVINLDISPEGIKGIINRCFHMDLNSSLWGF